MQGERDRGRRQDRERQHVLASLLQFSSVAPLFLTLRSYGLQHARLPCPSPVPLGFPLGLTGLISLQSKRLSRVPCGSAGKKSVCNVGHLGLIPGLGRSPGEGYGNPLQYSCLENPHGLRSLVGCSPQGHKESDMTKQLSSSSRGLL